MEEAGSSLNAEVAKAEAAKVVIQNIEASTHTSSTGGTKFRNRSWMLTVHNGADRDVRTTCEFALNRGNVRVRERYVVFDLYQPGETQTKEFDGSIDEHGGVYVLLRYHVRYRGKVYTFPLDRTLGEVSRRFESGACFVATAAYSDSNHPHVQVLREFRDRSLKSRWIGRRLIDLYWMIGPPMARALNRHSRLKPIVRMVIAGVVRVVERTRV